MNPIVMAARIGIMAVVCIAFVMSVSSNFIRMSVGGPRAERPHFLMFGASAWNGWGLIGCALLVVALMLAIAALVTSAYTPVGAKVIDFLTAAILVLAGGAFVTFVVTFGPDFPVDASFGFGWAGIVTLFLLAVAAVLAVVAGVLTGGATARLAVASTVK